jgi:bifunctional DNA-binding transcriptional regulator/antitoxin component of YhaV-PrlF toxin-antitoxin module
VDFRNLNRATLKDEYLMPVANLLVDSASGNKVISFLDGNAGYNQIFMVKEDVSKTVFCCPGFVGLFEWVFMTFGLKNAGATYQRAMNLIFHNLLGVLMEAYIDDMVVKSVGFKEHMTDRKLSLERMKKYGLQMNPLKCAFGITSGRFLEFIVYEHGIQIELKKIESIRRIGELVCKKDVQKLLGKINNLRHFISNLTGRVESLLPLDQLKHEEFTWEQNSRNLLRRSKNTSCLHPCCKL